MNRSPQGSLIPLALLCLVAGGLLAYFIQPAWIGLVVCLLALVFLFVGMGRFSAYRRAVETALDDILPPERYRRRQRDQQHRHSGPVVRFGGEDRLGQPCLSGTIQGGRIYVV